MAHTPQDGQPSVYAANKAATMLARWGGEAGSAVRAMGPGAGWPGTPPEALLGITANSVSQSERYCDSFCAIGLYQVPESTQDRLADDPRVRALLGGRSAAGSAGDWANDVPGQVAVGLVSLAEGRDALAARLGAAGYRDAGSQWALMLGALAYVLGPAGADHAVGAAARAVAGTPESLRFGAMVERLCAGPSAASWGYPTVRAWQRLATGAALAQRTSGPLGWFDTGLGSSAPAYGLAVSTAAYGSGGASIALPGGGVVGAGLGAGLLAYGFKVWTGRWPWQRR